MLKLLIVDDEPLIQVGIKSMLNCQENQIEICGTASNGEHALELIEKNAPDIVIADIKMPRMDGLTLAKTCKNRYGTFPLFIILTSHEDFHLLREALKYDIVDYLVKLDLTPDILLASIQKARGLLQEKKMPAVSAGAEDFHFYHDKFFISLLHNLFQSESQFKQLSKYLNLDFSYASFAACHCSFSPASSQNMPTEQLISIYKSCLQMLEELLPKYVPCYLFPLGIDTFSIIFCLTNENENNYVQVIKTALRSTSNMVYNYFNVITTTSVGHITSAPLNLYESYQQARQIHSYASSAMPVVFFSEILSPHSVCSNNTFNVGFFKEALRKSFEEYDECTLYETLTSIIELFHEYPANYLQAMDASCTILHLSISLLPRGNQAISNIFKDVPENYQSIYKQSTLFDVLAWLEKLRDGLCKYLSTLQKSHCNKTVLQVKKYIDKHIEEKLTLMDIASLFNITPNYLSLLFKKHSDIGFSEYITQKKIAHAKALLDTGQFKIYEIAERLSFENAFYFSKVFKKVEGCSPRDYKQYE